MTSHTDDEKLADEIYQRIKTYVPELKRFLKELETQFQNHWM